MIFFSVHGMMRDFGQNHLVKPLLDRLQMLFLRRHWGRDASTGKTGGLVGRLRKVVPSRLQYAIGKSAPDRVRHWVVEREIIGGVDWSQTPGFSLRTDVRAELRLYLLVAKRRASLKSNSASSRAYVASLRRAFLEVEGQRHGRSSGR